MWIGLPQFIADFKHIIEKLDDAVALWAKSYASATTELKKAEEEFATDIGAMQTLFESGQIVFRCSCIPRNQTHIDNARKVSKHVESEESSVSEAVGGNVGQDKENSLRGRAKKRRGRPPVAAIQL